MDRDLDGRAAGEVGVMYSELGRALSVVEDQDKGVDLGDVEGPTWPQEVGDHPGPTVEVRQPSDDPARGIDDIEISLQAVGQGEDVAMDEAGRQTQLRRQPPRVGDGPLREVGTGHPRPEPGPGERVQAEVALEVEQVLARDIADLLDLV